MTAAIIHRPASRTLALVLITIGALALPAAQAGAQGLRDNLWVTDGDVYSVLPVGNTLYVVGSFQFVGPATGSGVTISASTGGITWRFPVVDGPVYATIPDSAGGWYIGGNFTTVDGLAHRGLAHILGDGSVAPWAPNTNDAVYALALVGSNLYVGGHFSAVRNQPRRHLAMVATSGPGVVNPDWIPEPDGDVYALAADGRNVYAGGFFSNIGGAVRPGLALLDSTAAATDWNPGLDNGVDALALVGSSLFVVGAFSTVGGLTRNNAAEINTVTGAVTGWDPEPNGEVYCIAPHDNTVYMGGAYSKVGGVPRFCLAAVDSSVGTPLPWSPTPDQWVNTISVYRNRVYVGGEFGNMSGVGHSYVAAVDSATGAVLPWDPSAASSVYALCADKNTVYVGGDFRFIGAMRRGSIAAFDLVTGRPTPERFGGGANGPVYCLGVSGTTLYAGGAFLGIFGLDRPRLASYDLSASQGTGWDPRPDDIVDAVIPTSTGVYVAGRFLHIGPAQAARDNVAALDSTGTPTAWSPVISSGVIFAMALRETTAYLGGRIISVDGEARFNLAAIDLRSGNVMPWNPNVDGYVRAIALSDSTALIGGDFTSVGGVSRKHLAEVTLSSGAATAWDPGADSTVDAVTLSGGLAYIGGSFSQLGGIARHSIGAVGLQDGLAAPWTFDAVGYDHTVRCIAATPMTIYAGGNVSTFGGHWHPSLAAITAPGVGVPPLRPRERLSISAFPMPVRASATFSFQLPETGPVRMALYDVAGRKALEVVHSPRMSAGWHALHWECGQLRAGAYYCRLTAGMRSAACPVVIVH